jgi:hypothetical protein
MNSLHRIARPSFAIMLLLSLATVWRVTYGVDGTEFSGGWLTGRLLDGAYISVIAYVIALLTLLWLPRLSALLSLIASVCCLPLLLYFFAPGFFRKMTKLAFPNSEWSSPLSQSVVWRPSTILPLVATLAMLAIALLLFRFERMESQKTK